MEGFVHSDTASIPQNWEQMHYVGENGISEQDPLTEIVCSDLDSTSGSVIHHRLPIGTNDSLIDEHKDDRSSITYMAGPLNDGIEKPKPPTDQVPETPQSTDQVPGIPQPILIISLVSATLTMASCVFNTLLPIYMVTELKMNMRSMGAFEGIMEGFSYIVRMFSGVTPNLLETCVSLPFMQYI